MKEKGSIFCFWLFGFGFVYAFFHIMPAFLQNFLKRPLTWGDTLDFFTPFAVIHLAYLLYSLTRKTLQSSNNFTRIHALVAKIALAVGFLLYVDGHGLLCSKREIDRNIDSIRNLLK